MRKWLQGILLIVSIVLISISIYSLMGMFSDYRKEHQMHEHLRRLYEQDRENSKAHGEGDYNIGENFDIMEDIARVLPLTGKNRPEWDEKVLNEFNVKDIKLVEDIGSQVYSEKERVNYASTPMFMIKVRK